MSKIIKKYIKKYPKDKEALNILLDDLEENGNDFEEIDEFHDFVYTTIAGENVLFGEKKLL